VSGSPLSHPVEGGHMVEVAGRGHSFISPFAQDINGLCELAIKAKLRHWICKGLSLVVRAFHP